MSLCLNDLKRTRIRIFNGIRVLYLQEGIYLLLFESLNKNIPYDIVPIKKLQAWVVISMPHVDLFEATFVPDNRTTMLEWINNILCCLFGLVNNEINIDRATLWMSAHSYKPVQGIMLNSMVDKYITCDWNYSVQFYNCPQFG